MRLNLLVCLVLLLGAVGTTAQGKALVTKAAVKADVLFARTDSEHVKSIRVEDTKYAPDCSTKMLAAPLTLAVECDVCGPKEACVEFKAPCDCDAVQSVKQKKHYSKVELKSGRVVELRSDRKGNVSVDYDRN